MKRIILLSTLTLSTLSIRAQNSNEQEFSFNNLQTNVNYNLSNIDINQVNIQNRGRSSSALNNLGNSNNTNKPKNTVQQKTTKPKLQVQVINNPVNNINVNRGNDLDVNDNLNNVVQTNSTYINVNSNPVAENKNIVVNKPVVKEYEGLDFKPSGLSGRDYSNGGKLKKGEKNIYKPTAAKHKTSIHKRKPSFKKVKYRTSKCAKW